MRYILSLLVLVLLILSTPLFAYADTAVNLASGECEGGSTYFENGANSSRSFYMCYLLDASGNKITGTNAVLLGGENSNSIDVILNRCKLGAKKFSNCRNLLSTHFLSVINSSNLVGASRNPHRKEILAPLKWLASILHYM